MDDGYDRTSWTLAAYIEHERVRQELDSQLRKADREFMMREIRHLREMQELQKETNDIHFAQLSKTVSVEAFAPFRESVKEYIASHKGQSTGASNTVSWGIALAGFLIGFAGVVVAILTLLKGSP